METSFKLLGERLRELRLQKNLTQKVLADRLGVDRQYISKIENGKINMTLEYLIKIIEKLNCEYSEVFVKTVNHNQKPLN